MSEYKPQTYICKDCVFTFKTLSPTAKNQMMHCPKCGDHIAVKYFRPAKKQIKRFWSAKEIALIDRIINGDLLAYQVAVKLGRTDRSVRRRLERRLSELNGGK